MGFFNWIFPVPNIPTYRESVYRKHPLILTIDEIIVSIDWIHILSKNDLKIIVMIPCIFKFFEIRQL